MSSANSSQATITPVKATCPKFRFAVAEDISLLKEVIAASSDSPFARGSPAWSTILLNLATNHNAKWKPVSTRTLRDRSVLLVKAHIRKENYSIRQTGTSEEYTEIDSLLESVRMLFDSALEKQEASTRDSQAEAKKKEEDQRTVLEMRSCAMERLGKKRLSSSSTQSDSSTPPRKNARHSIADVLAERQQDRKIQKGNEFDLQAERQKKELELREKELALESAKLEAHKKEAERKANLEEARLAEQSRAAKAKEDHDRKMFELLLKRN